MRPLPESIDPHYRSSEKLQRKVAIITGGYSRTGRGIALVFAIAPYYVF